MRTLPENLDPLSPVPPDRDGKETGGVGRMEGHEVPYPPGVSPRTVEGGESLLVRRVRFEDPVPPRFLLRSPQIRTVPFTVLTEPSYP